MVDDKAKCAPNDTALISLRDDWEVEYWATKFGVSKERLTSAVRAVGPSAKAVEARLKRY